MLLEAEIHLVMEELFREVGGWGGAFSSDTEPKQERALAGDQSVPCTQSTSFQVTLVLLPCAIS